MVGGVVLLPKSCCPVPSAYDPVMGWGRWWRGLRSPGGAGDIAGGGVGTSTHAT